MKLHKKTAIAFLAFLFVLTLNISAMLLPVRFPVEMTNRTDTPTVTELNYLYNDDTTQNQDTSSDSQILPKVLYLRAEVMSVENITHSVDDTIAIGTTKQIAQIKIVSSAYKDRVYEVTSYLRSTDAKQIELKEGQSVLLSAELTADEKDIKSVYVYDYYRLTVLIVSLIVLLLVCVILLGLKGVRTVASILLMAGYVIFVFLPLSLNGISPVLLITAMCIILAAFNLLIELKFSKQAFAAGVGVAFGFAFAAFLGAMIQRWGNLTGLGESEMTLLAYMPNEVNVDFASIFVSCVMILFLGYIVKISIDCVKYLDETYARNQYISKKDLMLMGFAHCVDNLCNLLQILFFSAIAAVLPLLIVYGAYMSGYTGLFNLDVIAIGFLRSVCVAMSLFVSVPITCVVYSLILKANSIY